jgi:hypothetical protein
MEQKTETKAQRIVKAHISVFKKSSDEHSKDNPAPGSWQYNLVRQLDLVADVLRDVLFLLEIDRA